MDPAETEGPGSKGTQGTDPGPKDPAKEGPVNESQWTQWEGPAGTHGPTDPQQRAPKKKRTKWPLYVLGGGASVTIWGGWVGLGAKTGFGNTPLLPGMLDSLHVNLAIALPLGMELYSAYAFRVWLDSDAPKRARRFAKWSSIISAVLSMSGQATEHLLVAAHKAAAPWEVTVAVSCFPVLAALLGAVLHQLMDDEDEEAGNTMLASRQATVHAEQASPGPSSVQIHAPVDPAPVAGSTKDPLALDPPMDPGVMDPGDIRSIVDPVPATDPIPVVDPVPTSSAPPAREDGPGPQGDSGPVPLLPPSRPAPPSAPIRPRKRQAGPPGDQVIHTVGSRRVLLRDVADLLPRAREINDGWRMKNGRDIGQQKLADQMGIHKSTAAGLLKVIKAESGGEADNASDGQAAAQ